MRNVLILTQLHDPHLPPVADAIRARGAGVVCFNLADFPEEVALRATLDGRQDGWSGSISYQEQHVPLDSLASIWWRRPKQYKAPAAYSPGERSFLEEEANRGIIGVLESLTLQQTLWVSRLHSILRAELKPLQLAAAQQLGLRTPRTLLTNDPGTARAFYVKAGAIVSRLRNDRPEKTNSKEQQSLNADRTAPGSPDPNADYRTPVACASVGLRATSR